MIGAIDPGFNIEDIVEDRLTLLDEAKLHTQIKGKHFGIVILVLRGQLPVL